jgi:alcohol dehydrogenase class IV
MIERFSISATGNLRFGEGTFGELAPLVLEQGFRRVAMIVSTSFSHTSQFSRCVKTLELEEVTVTVLPISGEPSVQSIDATTKVLKETTCDVVVGIGGGSALDTAKAVAVMATQQPGLSVKRFLEGVGDMAPPPTRLPLYAVPTTAGTGSEATKNAVVSQVGSEGFKKSLRHDAYIPDMVIIDPVLALSVPFSVTGASG